MYHDFRLNSGGFHRDIGPLIARRDALRVEMEELVVSEAEEMAW
jgi:hypothetical protein